MQTTIHNKGKAQRYRIRIPNMPAMDLQKDKRMQVQKQRLL